MAYVFYAHFNRNRMQQGDPRVWTLHYRGQCIPAEYIKFNVPVETRFSATGRQPRATIRGKCSKVIGSSDDRRLFVL